MIKGYYLRYNQVLQSLSKVKVLLLTSVICSSCSSQEVPHIPERAQMLDNLMVYSAEANPAGEIQLIPEQTFGSTDNVLIGRLGSVAINENGRVFISDSGQHIIYVYEPDGRFITRIGEQGRGPGEFLSVPILQIVSNRLYAFDYRQMRLSVFSLDSLAISYTLNLNPKNKDRIEELTNFSSIPWVYFRNDDTFLSCFNQPFYTDPGKPEYNLEDEKYVKCYLMDAEGIILDGKILEVRGTGFLKGTVKRGDFSPGVFRHFATRPLITLSEDGQIYSAWSEDFLIKVHDSKGNYLQSWYYPNQKVRMTKENAIENVNSEHSKNVIMRNIDALPETWPALNSMQIDDENRIWVSTIVEDFKVYQWWVLNEEGKLLARFNFARSEQIEKVKNGYVYTRETDEETGLQQIVRYRIEFEEVK